MLLCLPCVPCVTLSQLCFLGFSFSMFVHLRLSPVSCVSMLQFIFLCSSLGGLLIAPRVSQVPGFFRSQGPRSRFQVSALFFYASHFLMFSCLQFRFLLVYHSPCRLLFAVYCAAQNKGSVFVKLPPPSPLSTFWSTLSPFHAICL